MNETNDRARIGFPTRGQAVDDDPEAEILAWALAVADQLGDPNGVLCFASLARRHDRALLDEILSAVLSVPADKIRRSRAALFVALVKVRTRRRR